MLAKYAGENKHLRSELKRLRARESLGNVHSTASKVADLESIFKELKLYKGEPLKNVLFPRVKTIFCASSITALI